MPVQGPTWYSHCEHITSAFVPLTCSSCLCQSWRAVLASCYTAALLIAMELDPHAEEVQAQLH